MRSFVRATSVCLIVVGPHSTHAESPTYWHTKGNVIVDGANRDVRIAGINWYGFETVRGIPGGLTSQDYKFILRHVLGLGYNTIRLPLSNEMLETPIKPRSIAYHNGHGPINTELRGLTSLQILDKIVAYAGSIGLRIILDDHRSEAGVSAQQNGLWYTDAYPESAWIKDWMMLAERYAGDTTVVGFDLRNEPHSTASGGACWDCGGDRDWHLAAQKAGNAVLARNPHLLVFVEGVDAYGNDLYWWGGNLKGVAQSPVTLSVQNQLIYSAHDYGPSEYHQPWFNQATDCNSLSSLWTDHWGYIVQREIAPVLLGEFGTTSVAGTTQRLVAGSEGQWFSCLVRFLASNSGYSWSYWALNGEDRDGLLGADYGEEVVKDATQHDLTNIQPSQVKR